MRWIMASRSLSAGIWIIFVQILLDNLQFDYVNIVFFYFPPCVSSYSCLFPWALEKATDVSETYLGPDELGGRGGTFCTINTHTFIHVSLRIDFTCYPLSRHIISIFASLEFFTFYFPKLGLLKCQVRPGENINLVAPGQWWWQRSVGVFLADYHLSQNNWQTQTLTHMAAHGYMHFLPCKGL